MVQIKVGGVALSGTDKGWVWPLAVQIRVKVAIGRGKKQVYRYSLGVLGARCRGPDLTVSDFLTRLPSP